MNETLRHKEAFEYYYKLGDKRSYPQVADKFTVSETSIKVWSANFDWKERIKKRDEQNALALAKRNDRQIVRDKAKDLKLVEIAKEVWKQQLIGKIDIECPNCKHQYSVPVSGHRLKAQFRDLDAFIRLSELLAGEADSRPEQVIRLEYVDPIRRERNGND